MCLDSLGPEAAYLPEAMRQLLLSLKMTGIVHVAVKLNNGVIWQFTVTGMY